MTMANAVFGGACALAFALAYGLCAIASSIEAAGEEVKDALREHGEDIAGGLEYAADRPYRPLPPDEHAKYAAYAEELRKAAKVEPPWTPG